MPITFVNNKDNICLSYRSTVIELFNADRINAKYGLY